MEDDALFRQSGEGDEHARKVLIEKHLGLVRHVVRRFEGRGVEAEDLFQIGSIGLIKAVDGFDASLGTRFSTYAVPLIMGEIRCFLRDDALLSPKSRESIASLEGTHVLMDKETAPLLERIAQDAGEGGGRAVTNPGEWDAEKERVLDRMTVRQMMESLRREDQKLLWLRFFRERTQTQTGKALGISQVQVGRREKRILETLKKQGIS